MPDQKQDARTTAASIRDVPASCKCAWTWDISEQRFVILTRRDGCPWHIRPDTEQDTP